MDILSFVFFLFFAILHIGMIISGLREGEKIDWSFFIALIIAIGFTLGTILSFLDILGVFSDNSNQDKQTSVTSQLSQASDDFTGSEPSSKSDTSSLPQNTEIQCDDEEHCSLCLSDMSLNEVLDYYPTDTILNEVIYSHNRDEILDHYDLEQILAYCLDSYTRKDILETANKYSIRPDLDELLEYYDLEQIIQYCVDHYSKKDILETIEYLEE